MSITAIWVDADACPNVIKETLFRAANRLGIRLILVANQLIRIPNSKHISAIQVPPGFDVADNYIVHNSEAGDLVITADIPLAAELIDKGCLVLNPRGELYSLENIRARLNMRDFADSLRGSGIHTGGPAQLGQAERHKFAGQLDRLLARRD